MYEQERLNNNNNSGEHKVRVKHYVSWGGAAVCRRQLDLSYLYSTHHSFK